MIRRFVVVVVLLHMAVLADAADEKAKTATPSDQDNSIGRKLSERIGPYLQTVPFYFTKDETRDTWQKEYQCLTVDEKVHYCIFQLKNEFWSESFSPWSDKPYSKEPEATASRELVKLGRAAIPQLLGALDSRVSTKIYPSRHMRDPWVVQDAAMDTIENIACRHFADDTQLRELSNRDETDRAKLRKRVADWWEKNKGSDEVQWAKDALSSDTVTKYVENWGAGPRWYSAIDSLYRRLGKESNRFLATAYHRIPKSVKADETRGIKLQILQRLLKAPTANEKAVFASALQDALLWVRIDGAEGVWAIGDPSGLEAMVKETEGVLIKDRGSPAKANEKGLPVETGESSLDLEYDNLLSFFRRCNTVTSREAIYKCLRGRNPYLRAKALQLVPELRMEKAVRALPEFFDDPFVLGGSYTRYDGKTETTVPPRRVCDEAAETFTKVAPDAPRFVGSTAPEQQSSIDKIRQWWKENGSKLKWDEKRGMLVRPAKE